MRTDFKKVNILTSVSKTINLSLTHKQDCFPVFNEEDILVGTVTYKELMNSHPNRIISDAMTKQYFHISSHKSIWDAKALFDDENTDNLLVMDKDSQKLVGILIKASLYAEIGKHCDPLTGLFSREYMKEAMINLNNTEYLPLSVIIIDINGLHLINNAFGYSEGDKLIRDSAELIQKFCRQNDILARVSGGEFILLLTSTDNDTVYNVMNNIQEACLLYNQNKAKRSPELNLSIGYAIKEYSCESLSVTVKNADEYLRNQKLLNHRSFHSQLISSMMYALYERSEETEEHSHRLAEMSKRIGEKLKVAPKSLSELELFAMLHDIGKIGIDDRILKKPGALTDEEWIIMKTHPEIGYRITKSTSVLESIADYVLTHHERWDGKGYPNGLQEEEVPLLSRILAITDAYDSMVNDRIYRKAISVEDAIEEIQKNAGTQFDPKIVDTFVEIMAGIELISSHNDEAVKILA